MNKAVTSHADQWTELIAPVQKRYDREYRVVWILAAGLAF